MTDLTIRQILDAMTRALDETARHFADKKPERASEDRQSHPELEGAADQSFDNGRAS
jgi:hypothetical protein